MGIEIFYPTFVSFLGIKYSENAWAAKDSWEFINGIRIMDFHYNKWATT